MKKAVVNLTTGEYFIYTNMEDKNKYLKKLMDFSDGTKILANMLNFCDNNIKNDTCGECYWNEKDNIQYDIDVEDLHNNFKDFDEVPKMYLK